MLLIELIAGTIFYFMVIGGLYLSYRLQQNIAETTDHTGIPTAALGVMVTLAAASLFYIAVRIAFPATTSSGIGDGGGIVFVSLVVLVAVGYALSIIADELDAYLTAR